METITLTINGNTISARAGGTILEVCRARGIKIPTLCHHDALRPIGACRLCQVEDEVRGVVVPACVTKIAPGMVIRTDSERVRRNRKNIVRMLMAAHPESCVVCEKGNTCELRKLAAEFGVGHHGLDRMPYHPTVQDLNPFMVRDLSKCIMCAKCVRADQEAVCEGVIDYNFRGFDAHPATVFGRPLENADCTFCGSCLSVCPVGAIAEKNKRRIGHAGARTRGVCSFCACGCSIYLEHDREMVRGVSPTKLNHTANGITLCVKGHFGHDYVSSPERVATPLIKTEEGFRPAGWDEALNLVGEKLGAVKAANGPDALGFIGGARSTLEENYLFQKLARTAIGTNNVDFSSRAEWAPVFDVLREATGFGAGSGSFKDVEESGAILVIGADPTRSAPVLGFHIKRAARRGAKLIVADPVETKLFSFSQNRLRLKPGSDGDLLRGMLKVIIEEDLADRQFIATNTEGYAALEERLGSVDVAESARACGIGEDDLRSAAWALAEASTAFVVFGRGLAGQPDAGDLTRLIVDLVLITGNLGKDRAGIIPVLKDANAQGAMDMGVRPDLLPGHSLLSDPAARKRLTDVWGEAPPEKAGLDARSMLKAAKDGRIKAMYVLAENTAAAWPEGNALSGLEFLVVQDLFLTETAKLADVVLPSAAWPEKEGTAVNLERRVQRLNRATPTPGGFPADLEVLCELARRLGRNWDYPDPGRVLAEIEGAVPLYAAMADAEFDRKAVFWPRPGLEEVTDTLPHGIGHSNGRARFMVPLADASPAPAVSSDFPLLSIRGGVLQQLGTGARTGRSLRLRKAGEGFVLGMNPADLNKNGLGPGDMVRVTSADGSLEMPVKADGAQPEGTVFLPASFGAVPWTLFGEGAANLKLCPVRVEKVGI